MKEKFDKVQNFKSLSQYTNAINMAYTNSKKSPKFTKIAVSLADSNTSTKRHVTDNPNHKYPDKMQKRLLVQIVVSKLTQTWMNSYWWKPLKYARLWRNLTVFWHIFSSRHGIFNITKYNFPQRQPKIILY